MAPTSIIGTVAGLGGFVSHIPEKETGHGRSERTEHQWRAETHSDVETSSTIA
jgi:hypothetical protein